MKKFLPGLNKILPIILIALISLNTFGFTLVLEYLLYSCKIEFREYAARNLSEEDITVFNLSELDKSKLRRFDDEIKYDGHMYDIVKEETRNNDVYIYCVQDKKEDKLNDIIKEQNSNKKSPNKLNHIVKNLTKNYLNPPKVNKVFSESIPYNSLESKNYTSHFSEVLPPPPNFLI